MELKSSKDNSKKIILDLCGGTGSWSKPYKDAGYDVRVCTLPDCDILKWRDTPQIADIIFDYGKVYGILAAPPCTHFSGSGAQYWKQKDKDGRTKEALNIVDECLLIIRLSGCTFWAMENPVGRLKKLRYEKLGEPKLIFNPCDFGDPYTKKTLLWGNFKPLTKNSVEPISNSEQLNKISMPTVNGKKIGWNTELAKELRSITPQGFAQAFYKANQ